MSRGHPKTYRGWYSKESAMEYCKAHNEDEKKVRKKLGTPIYVKYRVKKNPVFKKNPRVYPWLTYLDFVGKK